MKVLILTLLFVTCLWSYASAAQFKISGLDYTARTQPSGCPDQARVTQEIANIYSVANSVRIYSLVDCNQGALILQAIKDLNINLRVALGIWLDTYFYIEFPNEYAQLINLANTYGLGQVDYVIVGSETQYRGDFSADILVSYVRNISTTVKSQLGYPNIKVTTADVVQNLINLPQVISVVDVVAYNQFSFWEGVPVDGAVANNQYWYNQIANAAQGKPILISEVGWLYQGPQAQATVANSAAYLQNFVCWASPAGLDYFYFSAYDALWQPEDDQRYWGIFNDQDQLKAGLSLDFPCSAPIGSSTSAPVTAVPTTQTATTQAQTTQIATTQAPTQATTQAATTVAPTQATTIAPTSAPTTVAPTQAPTNAPTTVAPTQAPTSAPTTVAPTQAPTNAPTTVVTTQAPTNAPTNAATTQAPTNAPTNAATTQAPTRAPTNAPTNAATTRAPTSAPTNVATSTPTRVVTSTPTRTSLPTSTPSATSTPSVAPTTPVTVQPTQSTTTMMPTSQPTTSITAQPTQALTTAAPTQVTSQPTNGPTSQPTQVVTSTSQPTQVITSQPTQVVTSTSQPTQVVTSTSRPTQVVTSSPTQVITSQPTQIVTSQPTQVVTSTPTQPNSGSRLVVSLGLAAAIVLALF